MLPWEGVGGYCLRGGLLFTSRGYGLSLWQTQEIPACDSRWNHEILGLFSVTLGSRNFLHNAFLCWRIVDRGGGIPRRCEQVDLVRATFQGFHKGDRIAHILIVPRHLNHTSPCDLFHLREQWPGNSPASVKNKLSSRSCSELSVTGKLI